MDGFQYKRKPLHAKKKIPVSKDDNQYASLYMKSTGGISTDTSLAKVIFNNDKVRA